MGGAKDIPFNRIANLFPLMTGADFDGLVEDIRKHGLRDPIIRYQGEILDGRNRYLACGKAGVKPRFVEWEGNGSVVAFVVSVNLHRRHLDESQRAMLGGRLSCELRDEQRRATDAQGANLPRNKTDGCAERARSDTVAEASALVNVGEKSIKHARKVLADGAAPLVKAVESGEVSVSDAAKIVGQPKDVQRQAVQAVKEGEARTVSAAAEALGAKDGHSKSNGKIRSDFDVLGGLIGKVVRKVDQIAAAHPGASKKAGPVRDVLNNLCRAVEAWRKASRNQ